MFYSVVMVGASECVGEIFEHFATFCPVHGTITIETWLVHTPITVAVHGLVTSMSQCLSVCLAMTSVGRRLIMARLLLAVIAPTWVAEGFLLSLYQRPRRGSLRLLQ